MSESCNSRHFSWLMKSCFPNPTQHHQPCSVTAAACATFRQQRTSIASLPEDLLLECLSRLPHSSLPSVSLVCRHWSGLLDSSAFYDLCRRQSRLRLTVFAFSVSDSGLVTASHRFGHDSSWKTASFLANDVVWSGCFHSLFSHARLAAIGRKIYIICRNATLCCDSWTGVVAPKPAMLVPRKTFAAATVSGKIYVAGGASRTPMVEEYDPARNSWCVVAESPRRRYGCIGAAVDGIFYIIGGLKIGPSGNEALRSVGEKAHLYASSMDLYDVNARAWLRSRTLPSGGCVVAACAAGGHVYMLASHAVELTFWRFNGSRNSSGDSGCTNIGGGGGGRFGEWCRMKNPPLPAQVRLDGIVRFSCVGVGNKVVLVQVMGCIDDLLRRSGRSSRGLKEGLVLVYDSAAEEWSRGVDLPEVVRRAACICVEC